MTQDDQPGARFLSALPGIVDVVAWGQAIGVGRRSREVAPLPVIHIAPAQKLQHTRNPRDRAADEPEAGVPDIGSVAVLGQEEGIAPGPAPLATLTVGAVVIASEKPVVVEAPEQRSVVLPDASQVALPQLEDVAHENQLAAFSLHLVLQEPLKGVPVAALAEVVGGAPIAQVKVTGEVEGARRIQSNGKFVYTSDPEGHCPAPFSPAKANVSATAQRRSLTWTPSRDGTRRSQPVTNEDPVSPTDSFEPQ
jgi:hypothetical protein